MTTFTLATVLLNSPSTRRVGKDTLPRALRTDPFYRFRRRTTTWDSLEPAFDHWVRIFLFFPHRAGGVQMGQDFKESLSLKELLQNSKGNHANCYRFHTGVLEGSRAGFLNA